MSIPNNQIFANENQLQMQLNQQEWEKEYAFQLENYGDDFLEIDRSPIANSPYKVNEIATRSFSETNKQDEKKFKVFQMASDKLRRKLFQETSSEGAPFKKQKLNFTHLEVSQSEDEPDADESYSDETFGFNLALKRSHDEAIANGTLIPSAIFQPDTSPYSYAKVKEVVKEQPKRPVDTLNLNFEITHNNLYQNDLRQINPLEIRLLSNPTDAEICKRMLNYFSGGDRYSDFEVYNIVQEWIKSVKAEDEENSILLRTSKNPNCVTVCYYSEYSMMQKTIAKSENGWIAYGKEGVMSAESLFEFCKLLVPNFKIENFLLSGLKEHHSEFYQ